MKLYRFEYSCYARKVQMVLDLAGLKYDLVDVPYLDRSELLNQTKGYMQVPVLAMNSGIVLNDSRVICQTVLVGEAGNQLIPDPWQGPIWAYSDWADNQLEDVMFRIASPALRNYFKDPREKALFTYIKERKYGAGCIEQWNKEEDRLVDRARVLLRPSIQTLSRRPFLFGDKPTLADAALYGQVVMLAVADKSLPPEISPELVPWMNRLEVWEREKQ